MGDESFIIYSVGPNEMDGGGKNLYVTGIMEVDSDKDHGYWITLR